MTDKIRKRDTTASPTFHKGQLIDAKHLLEDFAKTQKGTYNDAVFDILNILEESARDNAEGCEWSHDLMLKEHKVTIEDHIKQCGCDCPFCEAEHDRVGAKTR